LCFFWQNISITPYEALVYLMLDAGLSILDTGFQLKTSIEHQASSIKYRASRIEYLALYGSNVNANDIFISDSGLSGLGLMT